MSKEFTRRDFIKFAAGLGLSAAAGGILAIANPNVLTAAGTGVKERLQTIPDGGFIMVDSLNPQNSLIDRSASSDERLRIANELAQAVNDGQSGNDAWGRTWNDNNPRVVSTIKGSYDYFRVTSIAQPQISKDNILGFAVTTLEGKHIPLSAKDLLLARPGKSSEAQLRAIFPKLPDSLDEVGPHIEQTLKPVH